MALMPGVTQKPVSAHGGPTGRLIGVVIHVTAGEGDPYNEFANPANQVSSHFGIGNGQGGFGDGIIEQYVDTAFESWAQAAGNPSYISVETEGEPTDPLTNKQVLSFASIMAWAHNTYGIPLAIVDTPGQAGLITHGDGGAAWGGHTGCPGPSRSSQRAAIIYIANLIVNPVTPPTTSTTEKNMIARDGASGGYRVARPNGNVYDFAGAPHIGPAPRFLAQWGIGTAANPVVGIVSDDAGGFVLAADSGGASPSIYHITADGQYAN